MPVVRGIVQGAAKNDYRFSSLIAGIVKSEPFEMKKALEDNGPAVTTAAVRRSDKEADSKEGR
jgi:thiazole synthase ThiGH ThiG subunit